MVQATPTELWAAAQQHLRGLLNADIYNLWFAPLQALHLQGEVLTLGVANDFCELWLKHNYLGLIHEALAQTSRLPIKVLFRVAAMPLQSKEGGRAESEAPVTKEETEPIDRAAGLAESPFNPKNTFETFVVGNNNTFAHAAAFAVAQAPGKSYNPLFVYGGVGLGKTHLLHAIGQYVVAHNKRARVTYLSSEKFTNEFIDAIQTIN